MWPIRSAPLCNWLELIGLISFSLGSGRSCYGPPYSGQSIKTGNPCKADSHWGIPLVGIRTHLRRFNLLKTDNASTRPP